MFKLRAFTLAEVIIVLAIIGVTASVAIPALNDGMDERKVVAQLRKDYAELDDAYKSFLSEYGPYYNWELSSSASRAAVGEKIYNGIITHLKVKQACANKALGCFSSYSYYENLGDAYKFVLEDGAFVLIRAYDYAYIKKYYLEDKDTSFYGYMTIDVNGKNGENELGKDIFSFFMMTDGLKPLGENLLSSDIMNQTDDYATAWVIKAGNRDYLRCSDLKWTSKRTCTIYNN